VFEPIKGRTISPGQHVRVYYNLRKECFSILDPVSRLVLAHASNVTLDTVQFVVYTTGRQRVRSTKQKNVHAFVEGRFVGFEEIETTGWKVGGYNPYFNDTFVNKFSKEPLTGIYPLAHCAGKVVYYRPPEGLDKF
jgi:hypothetical protein